MGNVLVIFTSVMIMAIAYGFGRLVSYMEDK